MTESVDVDVAALGLAPDVAASAPVPGVRATLKPADGLWPMARWERDRDDPLTMVAIASRVAEGERPKAICRSRGWPYKVVCDWIDADPDRRAQYDTALKFFADDLALSTVETVRDVKGAESSVEVSVAKLEVDNAHRLSSRLYRERYGERSTVDVNQRVTVDIGARLIAAQERLAAERARLVGNGTADSVAELEAQA